MSSRHKCYGYYKFDDPSCKVCKRQSECRIRSRYMAAMNPSKVGYRKYFKEIKKREPYKKE